MDRQVFPPDMNDDKEYVWEERRLKPGFERPIIVHRAILGSVERFTAILIEHLAGKWPFWMSPRQIIVLPISQKAEEYCESVYLYFHRLGYECTVDHSSTTIQKKIRNAQLEQYNYILVCGEEEMKNGTADVRNRDVVRKGANPMRIDEIAAMLEKEKPRDSKRSSNMYAKAWSPDMFKPKEDEEFV